MKRTFTLIMLMAFFAGIAVAQEHSMEDPGIYEPQFEINVNLTDEYAILEPYCSEEGFTLRLIIDGIKVDIPCMLPRGRADYVINAVVEAEREGYGELFEAYDIVIPATEHFVPDVDGDGVASIADVAMLIDHILNPQQVPVDWIKADCDGDGYITIADVVALIDYLLTGTWTD